MWPVSVRIILIVLGIAVLCAVALLALALFAPSAFPL
jgi:hypothetical protein